jgi:hypothetical protein
MVLENGHVGAGKSLETVRYFKGDSMVDMFSGAARIPRIKGKDRSAGVKLVQPVTREEYIRGIQQVANDRYLSKRKKKGSRKRKDTFFH